MSSMKIVTQLIFCFVIVFDTTSALHQGCMNSTWCSEENSYCSPGGFCSCKPDFTEIKVGPLYYACISVPSPVSGQCSDDVHCSEPATCDNSYNAYFLCVCPSETHAPSLNMTHCLEYATTLGTECRDPEVCSQIANAECFSGYCMCQTGHGPSSSHTSCLKTAVHLSDECVEDCQCQSILGFNTSCVDNLCYCKHGFTFNADRNQCYPAVEKVGQPCLINEQCVFHLGHARCNSQGTCRCATGYVPNDSGSDCILSE